MKYQVLFSPKMIIMIMPSIIFFEKKYNNNNNSKMLSSTISLNARRVKNRKEK